MSSLSQAIFEAICKLHARLHLPLTSDELAECTTQLDKKLDELHAIHDPVDEWGRSKAQQKEDADNPCRCHYPTRRLASDTCCSSCGFWLGRKACPQRPCDHCHNLVCRDWCYHDETYWEPRTWQTCPDCKIYILGLNNHRETCQSYKQNEAHCRRCGYLYPEYVDEGQKRCDCEYDHYDR